MKKIAKVGLILGAGAISFVGLACMFCGFMGMAGMYYRCGSFEKGTKEFTALAMDGLKYLKHK